MSLCLEAAALTPPQHARASRCILLTWRALRRLARPTRGRPHHPEQTLAGSLLEDGVAEPATAIHVRPGQTHTFTVR